MATSIARGAASLAVGRYTIAALGWAGTVILVRILSPATWGQYSLIFAITGLVGTFADLQLGRSIIRDLQDDDPASVQATMGSYLALRLLVGVVSYAAALIVVVACDYPAAVIAGMAIAGLVLIISAAASAFIVYFNAQMWMRATAMAQILGQVAQLLLTVLLALAGTRSLVVFTIPAVVFAVVALLWQLRAARGTLRFGLSLDRQRWGRWLKEAALLSVGTALASLYTQIDTVLLSKLGTLQAVGVYAIGGKFATLTGALASAVTTPLLVVLTRVWPDDVEGFVATFRRTVLLLFACGTAIGVGFAALAHPIVALLYGAHYANGARSATGLVLAQVVGFFSELCFMALVAMGRNLVYVVAAAIGVIFNVTLNVVLIPIWSYEGASLVTLATEVVILVLLAAAVRRVGPAGSWIPWRGVGKVLVAGAAMAAIIFPLRGVAPWEVLAVGGGIAYLALLHVANVDGPGGLRAFSR